MKKLYALLLAGVFLAATTYASVGIKNSSGFKIAEATDIEVGTGLSASSDGSTVTLSGGAVGNDGNWTSDGLAVTLDLAPTKFIATASSGQMQATQFLGSGLTASTALTANASKVITSSSTTDTELGYLHGATTPTGTGALVLATTPTLVTPVLGAATGTSLTLSGALSSAGITESTDITLANSETIGNATNGTIRLATNTGSATAEVYTPTGSADAALKLTCDAAGSNGDTWIIQSTAATDSLLFRNNATGSQATYLTLSDVGLMTLTGNLVLANGEVISNATNGTVQVATDTGNGILRLYTPTGSGTVALHLVSDAGGSAGDRFQIKNDAAGNLTFDNDSAVAGTYVNKATLTSTGALTTAAGITATTGNIVDSAGSISTTAGAISAATTLTAGTGITATTGNIAASSGNVSASGTVTGGTGVTATTGTIAASAGAVTAGTSMTATTTVTAGTGITATTGNINAATGNFNAPSGRLTWGATIYADGGTGSSSTLLSSSTNLGTSSMPFADIYKTVGGAGPDNLGGGTLLANGIGSGQIARFHVLNTAMPTNGSWVITPVTSLNINSFTMAAARSDLTLIYVNSTIGWQVMGSQGTVTVNYKSMWV